MSEYLSAILPAPYLAVATAAAILGLIFGILAEKSSLCLLGGLREKRQANDPRRLAAYTIAILTALGFTQAMVAAGLIDLSSSVYLATASALPAVAVGGLLFGFGAVFTRGCAGRLTVLAATGNLRAAIVVLVMGLAAYATMRGVLAPLRLPLEALAKPATAYSDLAAGLGPYARFAMACASLTGAIALLRFSGSNSGLPAAGIGLIIALGWAASATLGNDGFDALQPWSAAFVAPAGNTIQYVLTFTGSKINFGIAFFGGVLAGACASALIGGRAKLQSFESPHQTLRYIAGAMLMGFGGVLALGCTTGQGMAGISTLAPASFVALAAIGTGMWAGLVWDARNISSTNPFHPAQVSNAATG